MDARTHYNTTIIANGSIVQPRALGKRLLVMSNRAPIRLVGEGSEERIEPTVGGVGSTFLRLLEHSGGIWIAWPGGNKAMARMAMPPRDPRFTLVFQSLNEQDVSGYYYGMCNRGLWPLMHFMTPNCRFDSSHWANYCSVNRKFAMTASHEAELYDVAWVQDFHLALVPQMLRQRRGHLPIGLFWHVPWPPEQIFRIFPWRRELLEGMLGADLIGFHTRAYVRHFLDCCEHILGLEVDRSRGEISYDSRVTRVSDHPLGIPGDFFHNLSASAAVRARARRIRNGLRAQILILGVDRLDYTKGIIERLLAFERFLEREPEYRKRVTMVLIAVPSRTKIAEYAQLKRELDELVGRIVGRFSSGGWVPIRYLYAQFSPEKLVAYYQAADIAMLTPLRDGMNLIAKEFVASQLGDSSVLMLSEFAGAAEELPDALLVNPYDIDGVADTLARAIAMPLAEKRERLQRMRQQVMSNTLERWSGRFLADLTHEENFADVQAAVGP
jgi:trehalose 6-phosphate synthase/phosphatase